MCSILSISLMLNYHYPLMLLILWLICLLLSNSTSMTWWICFLFDPPVSRSFVWCVCVCVVYLCLSVFLCRLELWALILVWLQIRPIILWFKGQRPTKTWFKEQRPTWTLFYYMHSNYFSFHGLHNFFFCFGWECKWVNLINPFNTRTRLELDFSND